MKKKGLFVFLCTLLVCQLQAQTFTLKSKELGGQVTEKQLLNSFGCSGSNISPQLYWENAPKEAKSFAITMYDPDAPTGSGFWHWVVFDIPANVTELVSGAGDVSKGLAPKGCVQSNTDFGKPGYGGPCPPPGHGIHEYLITVYALKTDKLGVNENTGAALVGFNLHAQTISKASLVIYCER